MSSTCEKGAELYGYNVEESSKYCKNKKKLMNVVVSPTYPTTLSERFFNEKWVNICNEKDCNMGVILNPRDARRIGCYPTKKLDDMTGKLMKDLTKAERERFCGRKFYDTIPKRILENIQLGQRLLQRGAQRYYKSEIEDFGITEKPTSEMLYLWKCWIDLHGPDYGRMCLHPETPSADLPASVVNVIYPDTRKRPLNYYLKYKKWVESGDKVPNKGAVEWLLKGGNEAYLWLKTDWVREKVLEKYVWTCFDKKNRL
jgi:hypothetical protein